MLHPQFESVIVEGADGFIAETVTLVAKRLQAYFQTLPQTQSLRRDGDQIVLRSEVKLNRAAYEHLVSQSFQEVSRVILFGAKLERDPAEDLAIWQEILTRVYIAVMEEPRERVEQPIRDLVQTIFAQRRQTAQAPS